MNIVITKTLEEIIMYFRSEETVGGCLYLYSEDGSRLDGAFFANTKAFGKGLVTPDTKMSPKMPVFSDAWRWLCAYATRSFIALYTPDFDPQGTEFQKRVWKIVSRIPYGETRTYKEVGEVYKKEYNVENISLRSIGAAIGKNPLTILVPCHRVIGSDGSMKGYAAGIEIKKALLKFERDNLKRWGMAQK